LECCFWLIFGTEVMMLGGISDFMGFIGAGKS
jgi:hypothetical protein